MPSLPLIYDTQFDVEWLPAGSKLEFVADPELPPKDLITASHGFIFDGDKAIAIHHDSRGWDIPGGHIEPGETPETSFRRELWEEAGALTFGVEQFGYFKITVPMNIPGWKYPAPTSYMISFGGWLKELKGASGQFETSQSSLVAIEQIPCRDSLRSKALEWFQKSINWFDLTYLHSGDEAQRKVHKAISSSKIFELLAEYHPVLVSSFNLKLNTPMSDLDIKPSLNHFCKEMIEN